MIPRLGLCALAALLLWQGTPCAAPQAADATQAEQWVRQAQAPGMSTSDSRALYERSLPLLPDGPLQHEVYRELCFLRADVDPDAALALAQKGMEVARSSQDLSMESTLMHCRGYANDAMGNSTDAARFFEQAVDLAIRSGDPHPLASVLISRGQARNDTGDYEGAIADLKKAYDLAIEQGSRKLQYRALNGLANYYADANIGDFDRAIGYYRELLTLNEREGDRNAMSVNTFNIGATLQSAKRYKEALPWFTRTYELERELGNQASLPETERVIGATMAQLGDLKSALTWIDRAISGYRAQKDADGVARAELSRGIALRVGGEPQRALADLDASRAYFLPLKNDRFLVRINEERALALSALQRWQEAFAAKQEQFDLQRALDRSAASEQAARLRVQFGTERTEQANRLLREQDRRRSEAMQAAERERNLQRQVLGLAGLVLAILLLLAIQQYRKARQLRALALTDELTGMPNRRNIVAFLDQQLAQVRRSHRSLGALLIDIDHFKRINDSFGHDAGDRALRRVAKLAAAGLRRNDRLGRFGGEEFLIVLPDAEARIAQEIAERARRSIASAVFDDVAPGLAITISVGVGIFPEVANNRTAFVKRLDEALYQAKAEGRNRVVFATAADKQVS